MSTAAVTQTTIPSPIPPPPLQSVDWYPAVVAGVEFLGKMPDVAFTDQQWLVRRGTQVIQLSEVLYRILECCDGKHSRRDIAAAVTEQTEWLVHEDAVSTVITTRLMPLHLIQMAESVAGTRPPSSSVSSLLAVRMRVKTIPQSWIDPVADRVQVLFARPALVAAAVAFAAAHWWLYAVHGVGNSIAQVLNTPGALLLTFAIIFSAAFIHELGHAAALRYGGGRARGIGVGLYLIFPVFYTDATDSYRLGRAARVRTDLGGIYFHLWCVVLLVAGAWAFERDVLVVAALLINIEILRQFVPFVRLDGYWLLADLTGIPDFFSQIGPVLRRVCRVRSLGSESVLAALTPFARWVLISYTVIVLPLLVYLCITMIVHMPQLVVATSDAIGAQVQTIKASQSAVVSVLAVTQLVFLSFPLLGSLVVLAALGWPIVAVAGKRLPSPARRVAGGLGGVVAGAALLLWADGMWRMGQATSATRADAVIARARAAVAAIPTLQADLEGRIGADAFSGTLALARPNLAHIDIRGGDGLGRYTVISNGAEVFVYFPDENQYTRTSARADGHNVTAFVVDQVSHFFNPASLGRLADGGRIEYLGERIVDGVTGAVFGVFTSSQANRGVFLFVSLDDYLVRRVVKGEHFDQQDSTRVDLKNIRTGDQIDRTRFEWSLPTGASAVQLPFSIGLTPTNRR